MQVIEVKVPEEVYEEAGLLAYDNRQLLQELWRRGWDEHEIRAALYALDQIADARTDNALHGTTS